MYFFIVEMLVGVGVLMRFRLPDSRPFFFGKVRILVSSRQSCLGSVPTLHLEFHVFFLKVRQSYDLTRT